MQLGLFPAEQSVPKWIVYQFARVNGKYQVFGEPVILYAHTQSQAENVGKAWLRLMGQKRGKDSSIRAYPYDPTEDQEMVSRGFLRPTGVRYGM